VRIPVAHGEGRYVADDETLDRLEGDGRVVFRYVNREGGHDHLSNFNGSLRAIAGIVSEEGNVLGMMPHPERAVDALVGSADGLPLFESILARVGA
jgi:phosphoribosylformylglycinamidine synthase